MMFDFTCQSTCVRQPASQADSQERVYPDLEVVVHAFLKPQYSDCSVLTSRSSVVGETQFVQLTIMQVRLEYLSVLPFRDDRE